MLMDTSKEDEHPEEADDEEQNEVVRLPIGLLCQVEVRLAQVGFASLVQHVDCTGYQAEDHLRHADAQCELADIFLNM
eukprot:CAMPEP_0179171612 /NCGR_PEP_ID=MMETSP0796-20121207/84603_1 /TAXON_ID=73915 /ORGANISM="Pyrodinium bahamense, Strain pbaha01" /LENGTH=77 /DNA_ID=CAMNT_0020874695 /DNA_START=413 /DNA_END=646 /DNA_ORIENTATION=+